MEIEASICVIIGLLELSVLLKTVEEDGGKCCCPWHSKLKVTNYQRNTFGAHRTRG